MGNTISDAAITAALGRQMTQAVARQSMAAGNLANLDTPGYRTKDVQFADVLDGELSAGVITTTSAGHIGPPAGSAAPPQASEAAGLAPRRDGNNVQLDRELLGMTRAAGDFNAAQTVLAAKFRLVRYAINEGR